MELQTLYQFIELPSEVIIKLEQISNQINLTQIEPYLIRLQNMETAEQAYHNLQTYLQADNGNFKMLFCQLECARQVHTKYNEKHISDTIFVDTMKCFSRFLDECWNKNGKTFFDRGWWTYRQISMRLFRIGALEYELYKLKDKKAIAIHIPSDADFSKESVDTSLMQANVFFQTYYPAYENVDYICDSWLLSPSLCACLPENSNILSFGKRFDIVGCRENDKEFIEWLFQVPQETDYAKLPERTSLQRNVKQILMTGGAIGSAYGIMK